MDHVTQPLPLLGKFVIAGTCYMDFKISKFYWLSGTKGPYVVKIGQSFTDIIAIFGIF